MESKQQDESLEQVSPLTDDELLLRLHFSPEHIQEGKVVPTAINLSDLKDRGYRLDREAIVDLCIIMDRAYAQSIKNPENRAESYLSRFTCGPVRCVQYNGKTAFEVKESSLSANSAHAHILSAQKLGQGDLRRLRSLLLPYLQDLVLLSEYLQQQ